MLLRKLILLFSFAFFIVITNIHILAAGLGPFPVKGPIFDQNDNPYGTAHVYPRFVEIFSEKETQVGKVGILVEEGISKA